MAIFIPPTLPNRPRRRNLRHRSITPSLHIAANYLGKRELSVTEFRIVHDLCINLFPIEYVKKDCRSKIQAKAK